MEDGFEFKVLALNDVPEIAMLGKEYNPKLTIMILEQYLQQMFSFNNYSCFGAYVNNKLIGFLSGWITIKFTTGKLLEIDNVVIDPVIQTKDFGIKFFAYIESWAKRNNCKAIEIDTFSQSSTAQRFLLNLDYTIIGFHFHKVI